MESEPPTSSGATLDDMITHNELLERYPWLSAQILNGWRRRGLVRTFRGTKGMIVYSRAELDEALNADLRLDSQDEVRQPIKAHERTRERDSAEADIIREREWRRSLKGKKGLTADEEAEFERRLKEVRGEADKP
jgi:hypothetical protein